MNIKRIVALTAVLGFSITAATAAHVWEDPSGWWDNHFAKTQGPKFHANEVTLDLFGTYTAAERGIEHIFETNIRETDNPGTAWGGGAGVNYFFTRELDLGVDVLMGDNGGNLVDGVNASLIARLPWEAAGLAPYVFGGGGRTTDGRWEWTAHAGAGLEWRFNPFTGIFGDARYVWADDAAPSSYHGNWDGDYLLVRAGLRLAF